MKFKKLSSLVLFLIPVFFSCSVKSQNTADSSKIEINWQNLSDGLDYAEVDAPIKSLVNSSKIDVLKINPKKFDFKMLSSSEFDSTRTAPEWAKDFELNVVINAGMYVASNKLANKGFMQNYTHINNPNFLESYCAMVAFNPKDTLFPNFNVLDLNCQDWDSVKTHYECYSQGMRMLDCDGNALTWNKKNQSCSMALIAMDLQGNTYFIFCRSPYTHNEMIAFLQQFPFKLVNAIYLEGGPETSFYVTINGRIIEKNGSYISNSFPFDTNQHFWKLPNVIGVKIKK